MRDLPAAETHHSYAGGLLEHTVGVATLAARPPSSTRGCARDLLLAAALLHDVGRVRELEPRARVPRRPRKVACSATSTSACG